MRGDIMRFEYFRSEKSDTLYIRINKTIARKAFNSGSCVVIAPVNANPNFWHGSLIHFCNINYTDILGVAGQFERVCNSIIYYNCNNELGKYLKYYLPKNVAVKYGYKGE